MCGGMYVLIIVLCDVLPVRTLIDCVSVMLSSRGRRDLVCALVFLKSMCLCMRVMSPPPMPSARSCRIVV